MPDCVVAVEDAESWADWISKSDKMLLVMDIHQDWCGPCTTLFPVFNTIYLNTAEAETRIAFLSVNLTTMKDSIKTILPDGEIDLEKHGCMPFFLSVRDGKLVGSGKGSMIVSGANAPAIQKVIKEHIPVIVKEEEEEAA